MEDINLKSRIDPFPETTINSLLYRFILLNGKKTEMGRSRFSRKPTTQATNAERDGERLCFFLLFLRCLALI